jgi:hypothetical protein
LARVFNELPSKASFNQPNWQSVWPWRILAGLNRSRAGKGRRGTSPLSSALFSASATRIDC